MYKAIAGRTTVRDHGAIRKSRKGAVSVRQPAEMALACADHLNVKLVNDSGDLGEPAGEEHYPDVEDPKQRGVDEPPVGLPLEFNRPDHGFGRNHRGVARTGEGIEGPGESEQLSPYVPVTVSVTAVTCMPSFFRLALAITPSLINLASHGRDRGEKSRFFFLMLAR